jgi:hypothetical protein
VRHSRRSLLLILSAVVFLPGCSTLQLFQLLLEVRNENGKPLPGVSIKLDTLGNEERKLDVEYGIQSGITDEEGRITLDFMVSPYSSDSPHWYLKLTKEGFETAVIDIKPYPQPVKVQERIPLNVMVEMKLKENSER